MSGTFMPRPWFPVSSAPETFEDARQWCIDNVQNRPAVIRRRNMSPEQKRDLQWKCRFRPHNKKYVFHFRDPQQATLFALRWAA